MRLALAALAVLAATTAAALAAGPTVPPLVGTDPVTGKHVSLAAYAGRPLVINVWASWCNGCRQEASDLGEFVNSHPTLAIVGVDTTDSKAGARAFYKVYGLEYPSIWDPDGAVAHRLHTSGLPTTYFLDGRRRVVASIVGSGTLAQFNAALRKTLRG